MSTLILMVGPPGSGKSTEAKRIKELYGEDCVYLSRDDIRFALLKDGEDYFSHEDEVFQNFVDHISFGLRVNYPYVIADATHINEKSRRKLLHALQSKVDLSNFNLKVIVMMTNYDTCKKQNKNRTGAKCVPESVISKQYDILHYEDNICLKEFQQYYFKEIRVEFIYY